MDISCIGYIALSFLIIHFMLSASQSVELMSIQAFEKAVNKKSQSNLENIDLLSTSRNNDSSTLIYSDPFYLSNNTLILDKILIQKSSTINSEIQFFVEKGLINASLVTYNVGYYVEDINMNSSAPESRPLSSSLNTESSSNYAKGSGIFLTENGGIIKWDAFDQVIYKSGETFLYAGMIFFSPADSDNSELSFLKNQVGLYEFSIDVDSNTNTTVPTVPTAPTTHRTIWFWP
ncbi:hypothetical protein [Candidatus Nitrosocosmicus arcticus]|uniref:hypothetical protein n=1 Tax=Candidatus Nitrosocosmicus arcticus TaxID=2035267 RepID=UPI001645FFC2|nr:hypothetical protein [Candidatus Nitrosocosmicus arcticus]